jgi:hypothetical protein
MSNYRYRVVDVRDTAQQFEIIAQTPEEAVRRTLGLLVTRSGKTPNLVAKVYWRTSASPLCMVRLYLALQRRRRADPG